MGHLVEIEPKEIESRSFSIIETEFFEKTSLDHSSIDPDMFSIIRRVIHATGDFSFAHNLVFQKSAIVSGIESIRRGRNIYFDVTMGASGVSKNLLAKFGGSVVCHINDSEISETAANMGLTRTETAIKKIIDENVGIIAIGNAPTALIRTMEMIKNGTIKPDLVVGVPVGFVNAEESKELLLEKDYPFITCSGRKGGSSVAVAIINALLRLA